MIEGETQQKYIEQRVLQIEKFIHVLMRHHDCRGEHNGCSICVAYEVFRQ